MDKIDDQISNLEKEVNIILPKSYYIFLQKIQEGEIYEIPNTGIVFYSYSDLIERNDTYEIKEYDPNFFMIGQDGDRGYFINAVNQKDESLYYNDLGAIGSLPMKKQANSIQEFINEYRE
jgi:hypothetical protein